MAKKNKDLKDNIPEVKTETENLEVLIDTPENEIQALDEDNIPEVKTSEFKFVFKYYEDATFKSSIFINGNISEINCKNGIIKTNDENLSNFLISQPQYIKMEDK